MLNLFCFVLSSLLFRLLLLSVCVPYDLLDVAASRCSYMPKKSSSSRRQWPGKHSHRLESSMCMGRNLLMHGSLCLQFGRVRPIPVPSHTHEPTVRKDLQYWLKLACAKQTACCLSSAVSGLKHIIFDVQDCTRTSERPPASAAALAEMTSFTTYVTDSCTRVIWK